MRRELGDAFDPCGLLIESDFQPGQVGYDVQTVIRMLVQAAPTLPGDTEPMRSAYQKIRDKADAMVYSFLEACLYQRNPRGRYALTHFPKRVCVALMEMGVNNEVLDLLNTLRVSVGSRAGCRAPRCLCQLLRLPWHLRPATCTHFTVSPPRTKRLALRFNQWA
jgi:hypothetical protein